MSVPKCPGVFISMFAGTRLHCVGATDVFEWARDQLGANAVELVRQYGTHEVGTAMR